MKDKNKIEVIELDLENLEIDEKEFEIHDNEGVGADK